VAALATPDALERFSPLTGEPALLIDLDAKGPPVDASRLAAARRGLARLPAPSIGTTGGRASELGAALSASLDVRVADADELADVLDALTRHPLSCCALVQLLRHSEPLDLHEALVAESLVYSTLQSGPEFRAWLAHHQRRTRPAASGPAVLVERDDTTLCLTFNRPEKRNAFSAEMRDALAEALMVAHGDPGLDIVLRGRGPAFCSGGDLDEFGTVACSSTWPLVCAWRCRAPASARVSSWRPSRVACARRRMPSSSCPRSISDWCQVRAARRACRGASGVSAPRGSR
jgi:hypothetical protein